MNVSMQAIRAIGTVLGMGLLSVPGSAELIVNGGFEASSSPTATPPGWENIGHSDGVVTYALFNTPLYEGNNFYDLGGFGNLFGPIGDGIQQTVATQLGAAYQLIFGLSSEDGPGAGVGPSTLQVSIDGTVADFLLTSTGTTLGKAFTTQTIPFTATGLFTTISFIETANEGGGNNDPMIDCVSFDLVGVASGCGPGGTAVPEPGSLALLGIGLLGLVGLRRRRRS